MIMVLDLLIGIQCNCLHIITHASRHILDYILSSTCRFVDNYIIVNFTVYINRNVICSAAAADTLDLSYKYVVQISQEKSVECLLCAPHDDENTNRVLRVSKKTLLSDKGIFRTTGNDCQNFFYDYYNFDIIA